MKTRRWLARLLALAMLLALSGGCGLILGARYAPPAGDGTHFVLIDVRSNPAGASYQIGDRTGTTNEGAISLARRHLKHHRGPSVPAWTLGTLIDVGIVGGTSYLWAEWRGFGPGTIGIGVLTALLLLPADFIGLGFSAKAGEFTPTEVPLEDQLVIEVSKDGYEDAAVMVDLASWAIAKKFLAGESLVVEVELEKQSPPRRGQGR